jgi:predicted phage baseplate assembly protein
MVTSSEICHDEQRRNAVRQKHLNGLDYVEISEDQRTLVVFFLEKAPPHITPANVRIDGGQRVRNLQITEIRLNRSEDEERDDCMTIDLDRPGDFSTYTLRLVQADASGHPGDLPLQDFDPRYAQLDFSFKVGCPSDVDCLPAETCPPTPLVEPEISYLAKDYASFRQLLLDRLALIMPAWQERHVPDMGIALVEVLAYAGDHLSYYQDAVATEAYLDTARQRISVRRHARLVDYFVHEGCNARAWVCISTDTDLPLGNPRDVYFITGHNNALAVTGHILTPDDLRDVPASSYEVFEPLLEQALTWFRPSDFKQPASLAVKLRDAPEAISRYLQDRLSAPARHWLKKFQGSSITSAELQKQVIDELNRLLRASSFDIRAFAAVTLRPETEALLKQNPQGDDLARLNRMLLEDAYPAEFVRSDEIYLYAAHSEIHFYTWGDRECCLPRGTTTATLKDDDKAARASRPAAQNSQTTGNAPAAKAPAAPSQPNSESKGPLHLQVGDILIFEEILGPKTLNPVDADPTHRQAVRLTRVERSVDDVYDQPIVEIEWAAEDALQFPLCLSVIGPAPDCEYKEDISVARGNVILVDHGATLDQPEELGQVPVEQTTMVCECEGTPTDIRVIAGRFQPRLQKAPLTFRQPLPANSSSLPVLGLLSQDPRRALPQIGLTSVPATLDGKTALFHLGDVTDPDEVARKLRDPQDAASRFLRALLSRSTERLLARYSGAGNVPASLRTALMSELAQLLRDWTAQPDLLESQLDDTHFVVEMDNDGRAHLRFGDGELGRQPSGGSAFYASYRVGNGLAGNVGTEAISHLVFRKTKMPDAALQVRNPLPSQGGLDAEPLAEIKLFAPQTFRAELQRAVSAEDYARIAERNPRVQRAAATLRWMGSGYEVQVAIDPLGSKEASPELLQDIAGYLHPHRRIGHDLKVVPAHYVALDIALTVCVLPHYLRGQVEAALLNVFSNRLLPNGRRGFFHPDSLTFGDDVYLSQLVAAAQAVPGVENVKVTKLQRLFERPNQEIQNGVLALSPLEVARLDNDPSFPEHGKLVLDMRGGR